MTPSLDSAPTMAPRATLGPAIGRLRGLLLASLILLLSGCYEREISGTEIRRLLTDATVTGRHLVRGYQFERQYRMDGSFTQQAPPGQPTAGKWHVRGDHIIIQWKNDRQSLSRKVRTDDKGHYWKIIPGKGKVVVEYDAFVGADGQDRRVLKSSSSRFFYWLFSWRGLLTLFVLWIFWGVIKGDEDDPESLGNRLWLSWRKLEAGGLAYKADEIPGLHPRELDAFLAACAREDVIVGRKLALAVLLRSPEAPSKRWNRLIKALDGVDDAKAIPVLMDAFTVLSPDDGLTPAQVNALLAYLARGDSSYHLFRALPALEEQTTDPKERCRRLWGIAEPLDDSAASALLEAAIGSWDADTCDRAGMDLFRDKPRACLLLGQIFERRSKSAATESTFDQAKARGLLYSGAAREHLKIQKSEDGSVMTSDASADGGLVTGVVAVYEALMFATYTPPMRKTPGNRSSGYVGSA